MNIFNEAIYKSHLEHSAKGQSWGKHKYIAIKNGRYIYPEDLKGDQHNRFKRIEAVDKDKQVIEARKKWLGSGGNATAMNGNDYYIRSTKDGSAARSREKAQLEYSVSKTPHEGSKVRAASEYRKANDEAGRDRQAYINARKEAANRANASLRSRQINDQINSSHSNATSKNMEIIKTNEMEKQMQKTAERKKASESEASTTNTPSVADQIKSAHANAAGRKTNATAPVKKEETKSTTEETKITAETTDEKKSGKSGGKKGGGSKKKSSSKSKEAVTAATASDEAQALGLTDEDISIIENNIDASATDRDTVIQNLALRVLKGDFGNGPERRKKLGKYYNDIQKRVNELMKELKNSKSEDVKHSAIEMVTLKGVMGIKSGATDYLMHVGNKNSGRYRRGSGDRPWQHESGHRVSGQQRNSVLDRLNRRSTVKDMSDDALKDAVRRDALEKQYSKINRGPNKLEKTKNVVDATSAAVNRASNKNRERMNRRPKKERMDLHDKTDKELRDAINRELLEKQYSDLFGKDTNTVSKGEEQAAKILDYAGDVLAVGSSALAIALAIKSLKG